MSFLTQLDVINEMLASLGESPLNSLDEDHPLTAAGVRMLRIASHREQAKSWWFNKELTLLTPDVTGTIYTPTDTIRVDPQDTGLHFVQRGRRLYKAHAPAVEDKYKFTNPVTCWLVRLLPFEDLPPSAQILVSCAAQKDFQKAYDADRLKYEQITQDYREAWMTLNAEHIRSQSVNLLRRPSTARVLNAIAPAARRGLPIY